MDLEGLGRGLLLFCPCYIFDGSISFVLFRLVPTSFSIWRNVSATENQPCLLMFDERGGATLVCVIADRIVLHLHYFGSWQLHWIFLTFVHGLVLVETDNNIYLGITLSKQLSIYLFLLLV